MLKLATVFLAMFTLCGCISQITGGSGFSSLQSKAQETLAIDKTTQAEVRAAFGAPTYVEANQLGETWTYTYGANGQPVTQEIAQGMLKRTMMKGQTLATAHIYNTALGAFGGGLISEGLTLSGHAVGNRIQDSIMGEQDNKVHFLTVEFNKKGVLTRYNWQ